MKTIYTIAFLLFVNFSAQASELYIRVLASGNHYATVNNQTQYNNTNIFRFFDLPSGSNTLQIFTQGTNSQIFNNTIQIAQNQRIVAEIDYLGNFSIIQTVPITYTNWYTSVPDYNGNNSGNNPYPNNPYPNGNNNNNQSFDQFLSFLDTQAFDSNKLTEARKYVSKSQLSASQLVEISKKFTFDSNRLEYAKMAYAYCYDKANYFLFKSTFTFSSNYSALEEYIEGQ